jgi:predicted DCC family thiol-disulfide oxidoreductase YuxK
MDLSNPILLYDGSCGFCQQSVQFILQNERDETVCFAPLQSDFASQILKEHPFLQTIDSIVVLQGKDVLVESDAVIALSSYLKSPYSLGRLLKMVPKISRDALYRLVAKHRHRFVRNNESCLLPSPQQRKRFFT